MGDVHAKNRDEYDDAIKAFNRRSRTIHVTCAPSRRSRRSTLKSARCTSRAQFYSVNWTIINPRTRTSSCSCTAGSYAGADVVSADGGRRQVLHARARHSAHVRHREEALEKFEQTRNPEHAATMSDEDQEGAEDMMEEEDATRDGDWMVEGRTTSA